MIKRLAANTYNFLSELIVAVLVLFLFYYVPLEKFPPLVFLFSICLGGFIAFILLLTKSPRLGMLLYFIIIFPLFLYLGSVAGLPLFLISCIGLFIFWRGISLIKESAVRTNTVLMFVFLLTGISLTFLTGSAHYQQQNVIILLFFVQIMLVLIGMFISKWNTISENRGKFILYYAGFLAGASLLGVIVIYGFKLIRLVFSGLMYLVALGLTYVLRFIYFIAELVLPPLKMFQRDPDEGKYDPKHNATRIINQLHDRPWWLAVIVIVAILIAIYIFYRNRKKLQLDDGRDSMLQITQEVSLNKGGFFKKRAKPPKDKVRSEIFYLEKFARKLKLGRKSFESLTDWLGRIGITENGPLSKIYQDVRYGEIPSNKEDVAKVKAEIIQIKQQFKEK